MENDNGKKYINLFGQIIGIAEQEIKDALIRAIYFLLKAKREITEDAVYELVDNDYEMLLMMNIEGEDLYEVFEIYQQLFCDNE